MKKYKLKRLLVLGLCNITSGIFFGIGCVIVEHMDNNWSQSKDSTEQEEIAVNNEHESSRPPAIKLAVSRLPIKK